MDGDLDGAMVSLRNITRAGVDGDAYESVGVHGQASQLRTVAVVETAQLARLKPDSYLSLVDTVQNIIQAEETSQDYLILRVGGFSRGKILSSRGGVTDAGAPANFSVAWKVSATWTVVYQGN